MFNRFQSATMMSLVLTASAFLPQLASGQQMVSQTPLQFQMSRTSNRIELIVSDSRILTMEYDVPDVLIGNPEIIRVTPLSPNQLLLTALQPGVTALGIFDPDRNVQTINVHVGGDVRALQDALDREFPRAKLSARALNASVIINGFVPEPDMVSTIIEVARDYFPTVIDRITVGGAQKVLLNVKIVEVSRTKLRKLGVDWALLTGGDFYVQSVSGLINAAGTAGGALTGAGDTFRFGIINNGSQFGSLIEFMEQNNLAKILAEPKLVATSGRPASFLSGGEIPIPVNDGLGVQSVEFREFGTTVDFVPIILGDGNLRLEVRSEVNEVAADLRDPITGTPGFRTRRVDTGVEMRAGQTLALAGVLQNRTESEIKGLPYLMDIPVVGAAFRRVEERFNEVELIIMVTPEFIDAVDPCEVPDGPGQLTSSPCDWDLYFKGYQEVPRCYPSQEMGPILPPNRGNYESLPVVPGMPISPIQPAHPVPERIPPTGAINGNGETTELGMPQINTGQLIVPPQMGPVSRSDAAYLPVSGQNQGPRDQTSQSYHVQPTGFAPVVRYQDGEEFERASQNQNGSDFQKIPTTNSRDAQFSAPRFIGPTGYDLIK